MSRCRASVFLVAAVVLAVVTAGVGTLHRAGAASAASPRWWVTASAVAQIRALDVALATSSFDSAATNMSGPVPRGWTSIPSATYSSYADFSAAVAAGKVPTGVRTVMYDIESWTFTPTIEQQNAAAYEQAFARLAHRQGYRAFVAPALDLVSVQPWYDPAKSRSSQYLSHAMAAAASQYADGIDIQAQSLEADAGGYASFVQAASSQARTAHPGVIVLAGLSTGPNGLAVTGSELYSATLASVTTVEGYWLNVPGTSAYCPACLAPDPQVAVDYLRLLGAG